MPEAETGLPPCHKHAQSARAPCLPHMSQACAVSQGALSPTHVTSMRSQPGRPVSHPHHEGATQLTKVEHEGAFDDATPDTAHSRNDAGSAADFTAGRQGMQ